MKRIAVQFVLLFAIIAFPALAQDKTPVPVPAPATDTPKLTSDQQAQLRTLQVQIQQAVIQQYKNRDQYEAAQKMLDDQAQQAAKELEAKITEISKGVDPTKFVFNRGTFTFDPVKPTVAGNPPGPTQVRPTQATKRRP